MVGDVDAGGHIGVGLAGCAGFVAGRRTRRTHYRPDPWRAPEWLVVACGVIVAATYAVTVHDPLSTGVALAWPHLRLAPFLATLVAALPGLLTPEVPSGQPAVRRTPAKVTVAA